MREKRLTTPFLLNHVGFVQDFSRFLGHFSFLRERQKRKVNAKFFFGVDFLEPPMAFCRQIESMHLKAKGLLKPLKTRLFSANNFFVENKRVLKVFSCFEAPSALTNFLNYCCPLKVE